MPRLYVIPIHRYMLCELLGVTPELRWLYFTQPLFPEVAALYSSEHNSLNNFLAGNAASGVELSDIPTARQYRERDVDISRSPRSLNPIGSREEQQKEGLFKVQAQCVWWNSKAEGDSSYPGTRSRLQAEYIPHFLKLIQTPIN